MLEPFGTGNKPRRSALNTATVLATRYDVDFQSIFFPDYVSLTVVPAIVLHHEETKVAIIIVPAHECIDGKMVTTKDMSMRGMVEYYFYCPDISEDGLPKIPEKSDYFNYIHWKSLRSKIIQRIPFELLGLAIKELEVKRCRNNFIEEYGDLSDFEG